LIDGVDGTRSSVEAKVRRVKVAEANRRNEPPPEEAGSRAIVIGKEPGPTSDRRSAVPEAESGIGGADSTEIAGEASTGMVTEDVDPRNDAD
jgi:hypothetical protein